MKIWFRVPTSSFGSWTIVYDYLFEAFKNIGIELVDKPTCGVIELWWGNAKDWLWSDETEIKVGYTLTESRSIQRVQRQTAIKNLQQCNLIICPTFHASIGIAEAPVDVPIKIIPFGVKKSKFQFIERDFCEKPFKFLLIGNTQFRKGSWLALEAMIRAFTPFQQVQLSVECFMGETPMFSKLEAEFGGHPLIKFGSGRIENVIEHYRKHHVLVSPHLAEGFGLTIPEALATGMPAIISRCSAPLEFFSEEFGWWIEMSEDYVPVRECLENTAGFWRLPNLDSLVEKLRIVFQSPEQALRKGIAGAKFVHQYLTWENTARQIVLAIGELDAYQKRS